MAYNQYATILGKRSNPNAIAQYFMEERVDPPFLRKHHFGDKKGWGIVANESISKGSFICEYRGKLISFEDIEDPESSYIYEFEFKSKTKCIDATKDDGSLGRLINDSCYPNASVKLMITFGYPHLCLFALEDIQKGDEIVYRYGPDFPWHKEQREQRKNTKKGEQGDSSNESPSMDLENNFASVEEGNNIRIETVLNTQIGKPDGPSNEPSPTEVGKNTRIGTVQKDLSPANSYTNSIYGWIEKFSADILQNSSDTNYVESKINELGTKIEADKLSTIAAYAISGSNDATENYAKIETVQQVRVGEQFDPSKESSLMDLGNDFERKEENNTRLETVLKTQIGKSDGPSKKEPLSTEVGKKKESKCLKVKCPFCGIGQTYLKQHAMVVHKLSEENASALKSQYGLYRKRKILPDASRKHKQRHYSKRQCPVTGCSKIVSRLDNHLRQTHKVKCDKTFKKLLQDSKEMIVKDSSSKESSEEEKSSSEEESSSDESDYMQFKNIVQRRHTKKYLETVKDVPVDSEDSEDEDWLVSRVKYWANKKQGKQERRVISDLGKNIPDNKISIPDDEHTDENLATISDSGLSISNQDQRTYPNQKSIPDQNQRILPNQQSIPNQDQSTFQNQQSIPDQNQRIFPNQQSISNQDQRTYPNKKSIPDQIQRILPNQQSIPNQDQSTFQNQQSITHKRPIIDDHHHSDDEIKKAKTQDDYESEELFSDSGIDFLYGACSKKLNSITDNLSSDEENEDDEDDELNIVMMPWKTSVFDEFFNWLVSPDGKSKSKRQATQHFRQVQLILKQTSQETFAFRCFFDRKALRDKWLLQFESMRKKAGTIKSYLYSLRFFYKFMQTDHPECLTRFEDRCPEMINVIDGWITVYRQKQKQETWKNELKQLEEMITTADITKFDQSDHVKECKKSLQSFCKLSIGKYTSVRDYIMISICLDNASRTGAIANMTLGEFKRAVQGKENIASVRVLNHKTVDTSGPAVLSFSKKLFEEANTFLTHFRNKLEGIDTKDDAKFFVSWNGNAMSSSMVTMQLHSFWGKTVGHSDERPRFNATKVRKFAVTKVYEEKPQMKKNLALLMCHSEKTANKSYYLQEKTKTACETSSNLRELMRVNTSSPQYDDNDRISNAFKDCLESKKITMTIIRERRPNLIDLDHLSDIQIRDKIRYIMSSKADHDKNLSASDNEEYTIDKSETCSVTSSASCSIKSTHRVEFLPADKELIMAKFGMLITGTQFIKGAAVEARIDADPEMSAIKECYGVRRLTEKIRSERKKFNRERK